MASKPKVRSLNSVLQEIVKELVSATEAYGPFNSPHEGYAIILEELDELWDDIKGKNWDHMSQEAKQVAAMAIRFMIDFDSTMEKKG